MVGLSAGGTSSRCFSQDSPEVFIRVDHPRVLDFINSKKDLVIPSGNFGIATFSNIKVTFIYFASNNFNQTNNKSKTVNKKFLR
jgi:hypothetical protein